MDGHEKIKWICYVINKVCVSKTLIFLKKIQLVITSQKVKNNGFKLKL